MDRSLLFSRRRFLGATAIATLNIPSMARAARTRQMKALMFDGQSRVRLVDAPVPSPKAGEVLVQVTHSGVCQTDIRQYVGRGAETVQGHEFEGRVRELGPGVKRFRVGDRVTCYPFLYCGRCPTCQAGREHICPDKPKFNQLPQGGYAEYIALPERGFMPLAEDIGEGLGVLVLDVIGMMYRALKLARVTKTSTVAIVGLQPYGLGGVCVAKEIGANVVAFDASGYRRRLATDLGADTVVDSREKNLIEITEELTKGTLFDAVIECDDPAIPIRQLPRWVRPGGTLCLEGHTLDESAIRPVQLTIREITITGTPLYHLHEHDTVVDLLRRCPQASRIITHRPKLAEAKPALDAYVAGNAGKVAFDLT